MLWAVGMVKDEADVIYDTVTHLASEGVDGVMVLDNMSTDDTVGELQRAQSSVDCRVVIVEDEEPGYYQARKMTAAAETCVREFGASWIVPFDADELWYHPEVPLTDLVERCEDAGQRVVWADMLNHYRTTADSGDLRPFEFMQHRHPDPNPLPKVMFRWTYGAELLMGNHGVILPGHAPRHPERVMIRHFSNRSPEQFLRKARNGAAAYAAAEDLPAVFGTHWREYGQMSDAELLAAFDEHFVYRPDELVHDPAPLRRWTSGR
jgi:glycosyltransferase involved in cell wall biosynthesis